jgi:hypothetical protein
MITKLLLYDILACCILNITKPKVKNCFTHTVVDILLKSSSFNSQLFKYWLIASISLPTRGPTRTTHCRFKRHPIPYLWRCELLYQGEYYAVGLSVKNESESLPTNTSYCTHAQRDPRGFAGKESLLLYTT